MKHHAALHAPLRLDAVIHDLVPVFARQDLRKGREGSRDQPPQPWALRVQLWSWNLPCEPFLDPCLWVGTVLAVCERKGLSLRGGAQLVLAKSDPGRSFRSFWLSLM